MPKTERRWAALLAAVALAGAARPAAADVVDVSLTTLAIGREDPRGGELRTVVPLYELLSLRVLDIRNPVADGLNVMVSGWGAVDLGELREDHRLSGDLDLAFVEGALLKKRLQLRLGRQLIFGGAARAVQMDGGAATVRLVGDFGLSGWAGVPVVPRFADRRSDFVGGGRAFWRRGWETEVGVSFNETRDVGRDARREIGADARYAPRTDLFLNGSVFWSLLEERVSEAFVSATWQTGTWLQATVDWRRTAPDLFILRSSIFSVFSDERRDELGGVLYGTLLGDRLALTGDYHLVDASDPLVEDEREYGHRAGVRAMWNLQPRGRSVAGAEARLLELGDEGYKLGRLFVMLRLLPRVLATADVNAYFLDREINGYDKSLTATASAVWDVAPGWQAMLTGLGGVTPFLERRLEVLARLVYNGSVRVREVRK